MFDPVAQLIIPMRTDTVTLKAANLDLAQALLDFTTASGFLAVPSTDLAGAVTLDADKLPVDQVLDKLAEGVGGKWRPIYLLALPRVLSEEEQEARAEQGFQSRWAQFWAKSPADRAQDIQSQVQRIQQFSQRAREAAANGQQGRGAGRMQRFGQRMMSRLSTYSAGLSPSQRAEIHPLLKALGAAVNQ